jgi:hypothetical protein
MRCECMSLSSAMQVQHIPHMHRALLPHVPVSKTDVTVHKCVICCRFIPDALN